MVKEGQDALLELAPTPFPREKPDAVSAAPLHYITEHIVTLLQKRSIVLHLYSARSDAPTPLVAAGRNGRQFVHEDDVRG